jgi:FkbM family methyltransferase
VSDIASEEGIIEAGMTVQREFTGNLRYQFLRWRQSKGYYARDVQGSKMYLAIDDPGVSRDLIIRGMREREETRMIQKTLKPGMTVIDIGSNIGYYAMMEARAVTETGHVYAIEPEPRNVELLHRNVKLNGYHHVDVFQAGVSDETGIAKLYVSKHSNLHNLLRPLHAKNEGSVVSIKVFCLDDFIEEQNINPSDISFIRMDIEGYEVKALSGMQKILHMARSLNLFIEFHPRYIEGITHYSLESTMDFLASLGFRIRYANATAKNGYSIKFQNITIKDFLTDKRVSRNNVFMTFLTNF